MLVLYQTLRALCSIRHQANKRTGAGGYVTFLSEQKEAEGINGEAKLGISGL